VSIVIPVYNEEQSLPELLRRTEAACAQLTQAYEIVLVDDGSRDKSAQSCKTLPNVKAAR
jgi:undecaprenyl-phosphate 4-deoxy-4-formamido-L-arabinose transferase